jgi:hypothetical protein
VAFPLLHFQSDQQGSPVWPSECVKTVNQFAKQSVESFERLCCSHHYPFVIGKPYNHAADPRFEVVNWESGDGLTTTQLQTWTKRPNRMATLERWPNLLQFCGASHQKSSVFEQTHVALL